MDVSGGNSARGACFLAQVLKPLLESKKEMPNIGTESPEMDKGSREEAFGDRRAMERDSFQRHAALGRGAVIFN